jgi:thiamine monophosphate synthase
VTPPAALGGVERRRAASCASAAAGTAVIRAIFEVCDPAAVALALVARFEP